MFSREKVLLIVIGISLGIGVIWGGLKFWGSQEITPSDMATHKHRNNVGEKDTFREADATSNNHSSGKDGTVSPDVEAEGLSDSGKEELAAAGYTPAREALLDHLESNLAGFNVSTPTESGQFYLVRNGTRVISDRRVEAIVEDGYYRVKIQALFELREGEIRWTLKESTVQ